MSVSGSKQGGWSSLSGYIWSMIGSSVGFANLLSFSAHCYKNGGGAFLLVYLFALFLLGVPLLMLEGTIGKSWKLPIIGAYQQASGRWAKGLGWLSVIACLTIGGFYVVLTGYAIGYTYLAATASLPQDPVAFFKHDFLQISEGVEVMGGLAWPVLAATAVTFFFTWLVMARQLSSGVERICSIFMPLLALFVAFFAIFASFLPGGSNGWAHFLTPDFSRLMDITLWRDAFGQVLFSLSLGLGIIVGYSRHTGSEVDIGKAMRWVAIGDFSVSFMAGGALFCCIAYVSATQGVSFEQLMANDSTFEIGFILFPQLLQHFSGIVGYLISVLFFFSVFIAGITGVFSIIESIAGNLEVEFQMVRQRAVALTLILLFPIALLFCFGNGVHLIDAVAPLVVGTNMLFSTLALIFAFKWWNPTVAEAPLWSKNGRPTFASFSLRWIIPPILLLILSLSIIEEFSHATFATGIRCLWLFTALSASWWLSCRHIRNEQLVAMTNAS